MDQILTSTSYRNIQGLHDAMTPVQIYRFHKDLLAPHHLLNHLGSGWLAKGSPCPEPPWSRASSTGYEGRWGHWRGPSPGRHSEPCPPADWSAQHTVRLWCCPVCSSQGFLKKVNNASSSGRSQTIGNISGDLPSLLTTIVPTTPLWDWMRFKVSSTSWD